MELVTVVGHRMAAPLAEKVECECPYCNTANRYAWTHDLQFGWGAQCWYCGEQFILQCPYSELPEQLRDTYETDLEKKLRALYPHGHPDFISMCIEEMKLHSDKNHDYASDQRPLQNFSDAAAIFALFPGLDLSDPVVVALVYMVKQLVAVLHLKADHIVAQVEGMEPRMRDVGVYSKLIPIIERTKR